MKLTVWKAAAVLIGTLIAANFAAPSQAPSGPSKVANKTDMSSYLLHAEAALEAFNRGDIAETAKLAHSLEVAWDSNSEGIKKDMPLTYQEVDGLMDAFVDQFKGYGTQRYKQPTAIDVDAAYQRYVAALKRAEDPSYGTTVGGDGVLNAQKTATGLTYLVTKNGSGRRAKSGEVALVRLTGLVQNGVIFRRTPDSADPEPIFLREGSKISGLLEGIELLHAGDSAIFLIPPALGFGVHSGYAGAIPPNSPLIYFVELTDVKSNSVGQWFRDYVKSSGLNAAVDAYRAQEKMGFPELFHSEGEMNELGYEFLRKASFKEAIQAFRLNVESYPRSANAYDSLGDAYAKSGERDLAIQNYRKALAIDPNMESSARALETIEHQ